MELVAPAGSLGAQIRYRSGRGHGLPGPQERHQCPQLRRAEFHRKRHPRRRRAGPCARAAGPFRHQHFRAGRARRGMARGGGRGPFAGRGCRHHGRRGPAGLCQRPLSRPAAAPVGAGLGHARRRHRADEGAVRHQARGAAARADAGRDRPHLRTGQRRGRGVRLRQPVRDGRGPLPAVVLRHRRFPNNKGRSPRTRCAGWRTRAAWTRA